MDITGVYFGIIDGVEVFVDGITDMTEEEEVRQYVEYAVKETSDKGRLIKLKIRMTEDGKIALTYEIDAPKFERIRRITGYLVGTIDRWNNAKKAEERERVKHGE